jgi:hypothetical protein
VGRRGSPIESTPESFAGYSLGFNPKLVSNRHDSRNFLLSVPSHPAKSAYWPRGTGGNFHGDKRTNQTHASTTDPDARLYRKSKGKKARLSYLGHIVTENRHGLIAEAMTTHADGTAEADAALLMLNEIANGSRRITVCADKAYDIGSLGRAA